MKTRIRAAISGYYGCGNTGDEAVLAGIQEGFRRKAGDRAELVVLSQNPDETWRAHGLKAVYRMDPRLVRQTLRECDLLLSGGGSLLQDTTSLRSLLYYLWVQRVAWRARKPVMYYAQGLGPLRRRLSRRLVAAAARRAAYITVRDDASARLLSELGVRGTPVEVTADPAFALTPAPPREVDHALAAEGLQFGTPHIGAAFRSWGGAGQELAGRCARLLDALTDASRLPIALIPMQTPHDREFSQLLLQKVSHPGTFSLARGAYSPSVMLGLIARMEAIVALRLHTLIFAACAGVPSFALAYDPKVSHLMERLNCRDSVADAREFNTEAVVCQVTRLLQERSHRSVHLLERAAELERLALCNVDRALAIAET